MRTVTRHADGMHMLYHPRLALIALVLAGFFTGIALTADSTRASSSAWMAVASFAAAAVVNVVIPFMDNRIHRDATPVSSAHHI